MTFLWPIIATAEYQPLKTLPHDFRDALLGVGVPRNLKAGETIISAGDKDTDVFAILSGHVRISLLSRSGREPQFAEFSEDYIFGEVAAIDGLPRSASVTAITDTVILKVSRDDFRKTLFKNEDWVWWLLKGLCHRSRTLTERTFEFTTLSVHGRVISEILRLSKLGHEQSDHGQIHPFPTHDQLANRIGTQREAVTRSLRRLTKAGIIKQNRRQLYILSMQALSHSLTVEGGELENG